MLAKYVVPLALAAMFAISSHTQADGEPRSFVDYSLNQPLIFTSNDGQWDEQVHFRATVNDATMWFVDDGFYYQIVRDVSGEVEPSNRFDKKDSQLEYLMVRAALIGANESAEVVGERPLDHTANYFLGSDPSRWRTNVTSYEAIVYQDIYPGIDLKYYNNGSGMEYDFILSAGADPSRIRVSYEGAESIAINDQGELEIATAWGKITQSCPVIYQQDGTGRYGLEGRYELLSDNVIGFALADGHDPDLALVIDPVILMSSYLGGTYTQTAYDNAIDSDGNVVIAGQTRSVDFPVVDPLQGTCAGQIDVFITKIDPAAGEIIYSTYFGGAGDEEAPRMTLDAQDNIYAVFRTNSTDAPTVHPFQASLDGDRDAFVMKLNAAGDELLVGTYLGGRFVEYPWSIAVDNSEMIYVCGETDSDDFPLENAYADELAGGVADGFVTKLNASGDALVYSTYLGGSGGVGQSFADDVLYGIIVNDAGEAYVAGATYSPDYPSVNALYPCKIEKEGPVDAVITKFSAAGNTLLFSTFFGGTEDECIRGMTFDAEGNLVLVGFTESDDFPTLNAYQTERCPGADLGAAAVFVSSITGDGDALLFSTYFGGCDEDFGEAVAIGPDGSIFITGNTLSEDFPIVDPIYGTLSTPTDAFIAKLTPDASDVEYSTYFGGNDSEEAKAIAVDENGWAHITGITRSSDLPLVDPFQSTSTPNNDAFVLWMKGGCCKGIAGNLDGDPTDRLDILDITYSVDWYFRGGNPPTCETEADVDGSGMIDIEDLVYLVNYIFWSGPAPNTCTD